ncbi:hypothetical protein TRFO_14557 [Tritrichomonas foetus]|uniref:Uncharacterized protein n=1 Tax=Tritrichomonas foetus TaxID=1144522 RepID=A0A1J4KVX5_9EUKA|nr:hypothetical protein TRFO_14557 [Tritrichomonas foetus]|eukprot:OHT15040.1 hypothetical protein TRFO_14557 [Tritrichomonas foetus]
MTTISQQRLNEQRKQRLKYSNINWVTVPNTPVMISPRLSAVDGSISRMSSRLSTRSEPKTPYFKNSEISFTNDEISMLKQADSTDADSFIPLSRTPSRLERLQSQKFEDDQYGIPLSSSSSPSKNRFKMSVLMKSNNTITKSDSVVSFKPVELEDIDSIEKENETNSKITSKDSFQIPNTTIFNTASVTIDDIKEHVWMHCHENELEKKEHDYVKLCQAHFIPQKGSQKPVANFTYDYGERKVKNIIRSHSKIEQDREAIRQKAYRERYEMTDKKRRIESSYCAYKYQKYLYNKRSGIPDFLDEADFTEAKKVKINLKRSHAKRLNPDDDKKIFTPRRPNSNKEKSIQ